MSNQLIIPFDIISFNIRGLLGPASMEKVKYINDLIQKVKPKILLLQETHLSQNDTSTLNTYFPTFQWYSNAYKRGLRGVAIGLRGQLPSITNRPKTDNEGTFISISFPNQKETLQITNVYFPPSTPPYPEIFRNSKNFFLNNIPDANLHNIIAGDLNLTPDEPDFVEISRRLIPYNISFIPNPFPSRANSSRSIDHFALSNSLTNIQFPTLFAFPPPKNDHAPLLLSQHRPPKPNQRPSIPPHIASHPAFIKAIKDQTPKFITWKESPFDYLNLLKKTAHEIYNIWKSNPPPEISKSIHFRTWEITSLIKITQRSKRIPYKNNAKIHQDLYKELSNRTENQNVPHRVWRRRCCLDYLARLKEEYKILSSLQAPSLSISPEIIDPFKTPSVSLPKDKFSSPLNIINPTTNFPTQTPKETSDVLSNYWSEILSPQRPYDPILLEEILLDYPKLPTQPPRSYPSFSNDLINKILNKSNKSSTGPDGIPFCLYTHLKSHTAPLWSKICKYISTGGTIPDDFTESRLVLIPKKEGPLYPAETRPISVTNSSYRIIMKTWADVFRNIASQLLPPPQRALLKDRYIDDCIDDISNLYKILQKRNQNPILLQTDFQKAFDFINRESIIQILSALNFPPNLINVAKAALSPSKSILQVNGTSPAHIITSTGVKQGCPLSPILFIITFDPLIHQLAQIPDVQLVRGYMDDIALIALNSSTLEPIWNKTDLFCQAVGAQLNISKCLLISPEPIPNIPQIWSSTRTSRSTKYLGVHLSHLDDDIPNWNPLITKIAEACHRIKISPTSSLSERITLTNSHAISLMPFTNRFSIIPPPLEGKLSNILRRTLGSRNILPNQALYSNLGPFSIHPTLIHPILFNIACLAGKRPPNPSFIPTHLLPCEFPSNTIEYK